MLPAVLGDFAAIPDKPEYQKALAVFANYPERSQSTASARAHLYFLIRTMDVRHVLEIGTGLAGTTEVLARAVTENGGGHVLTIDPATPPDANNILATIASWPAPMREATTFKATSSGDFFYLGSLHDPSKFDLIFVDGNHIYDYALFDLTLSAKRLRPGGIMAIDNVEITGVYYALNTFLACNPNWKVLGASEPGFSVSDSTTVITKGPGSPVYTVFLAAPETISLSPQNFYEFSILDVKAQKLDALKIKLATAGNSGWLGVHVKFTNSLEGVMFPTWSVQNLRVEITPDVHELVVPLGLATPSGYPIKYQHADVGLIWNGDTPLYLSATPQLQTA